MLLRVSLISNAEEEKKTFMHGEVCVSSALAALQVVPSSHKNMKNSDSQSRNPPDGWFSRAVNFPDPHLASLKCNFSLCRTWVDPSSPGSRSQGVLDTLLHSKLPCAYTDLKVSVIPNLLSLYNQRKRSAFILAQPFLTPNFIQKWILYPPISRENFLPTCFLLYFTALCFSREVSWQNIKMWVWRVLKE